ncbi:MAG: thrombospondin type 3 repeat-containing protein, partial [Candidatus Poseidoniales archaeon]
INNDGLLWQAAYFSNGSWDQNSSTLMSTSLTTMSGPCEMPEMPEFELHYDNGSGPVMWEAVWNYEEYEDCTENTYEDGYSDWECDVDYEMVDYTSYYENCEYDNASMMFWCETWEEYPYLESGNYSFTLNVTNLEVGEAYELYANYYLNTQMGYDSESTWISWNNSNESYVINNESLYILVDEYMCSLHLQFEIFTQGNNIGYDEFSFEGGCEEMPSPFELYYDNGSGPVMWEPIWNYEEFDNCTQYTYEEGYSEWECGVDYDGDGMADDYWNFENCEYQNASMTYLCTSWGEVPYLESGNYTFTLNVTNLEVGENYTLHWYANFNGMNVYEWDDGNFSWTATDEYEHFELLDIEIDENTCGINIDVGLESDHKYDNDYFNFVGECLQPPNPLSLYYDGMLWEYNQSNMGMYPLLNEGVHDMTWDLTQLENGTEYNLTWEVMSMTMFGDGEDEINNTILFNATNVEMMFDWELIVDNNTCFIMVMGILEMPEVNWPIMNMAMFEGPCEMPPMSDIGLEIDIDGMWYDLDGLPGNDTLGMMMGMEDEYNIAMMVMDMYGQEMDEGNYTLRWTFEDLTIGENYSVLLEDLMNQEPMMLYENCTQWMTDGEDGDYDEGWSCMEDNGNVELDWCDYIGDNEDGYEVYECEIDNPYEDIIYNFTASSETEQLEWELEVNEDDCGFVFLVGLFEGSFDDEDGFPMALSMYALEGPAFVECMGDDNTTNDEIMFFMMMTDADGDYNMSWDEFEAWLTSEDGADEQNLTNEEWGALSALFNESDWNGNSLLDIDEIGMFYEHLNEMRGGPDNQELDIVEYIVEIDWTSGLGYTDGVNFTFFLSAGQMLDEQFRTDADYMLFNGDGELNDSESMEIYYLLMENLDTNPSSPEDLTLNGVAGEIIFVGYDIVDLASGSESNPAIISMWDVFFFDVAANDDGNYEFTYTEDEFDEGQGVPSNFCAISYQYSYEILEFIWNGTTIELTEDNDCIGLNANEAVPSFSVTYGQEVNNDFDNDGVNNEDDAFPYDPSESADTDGDGWGDNEDVFPDDADEWLDTDGDGVGDNGDEDYDGDGTDDEDEDSDGDGVNDANDDFPNDANESTDTDGDGVGDNEDVFPNDVNESSDLDGDGIGDNGDEDADGDGTPNDVDDFPLASSSNDADNDGVENDIDAFPNNPNEYFDTDGDGIGDNADLDDDDDGYADSVDAFPNDASEYLDSDGDGVGDAADQFPNDANERKDSDGDNVGDNSDAFPSNFNEWADSDNDGVGDNTDAFPNDATEIVDSDNDGVGNNGDAFPYNANEQKDSDNNGVGDNAQSEQEGEEPPIVEPEPADGGFLPGFSSAMGIVSMLGAAILVAGRRKD